MFLCVWRNSQLCLPIPVCQFLCLPLSVGKPQSVQLFERLVVAIVLFVSIPVTQRIVESVVQRQCLPKPICVLEPVLVFIRFSEPLSLAIT